MADNKGGFLSALGGLGGAIGAGSSIIGLLSGLGQKARGNRMLRNAVDPGYKIPKEFGKNLLEAESLARTGLPSEQYNLASTNIQRGTAGALGALGKFRNPMAAVSNIQRNQNDALASLDAQNAAARRQNILQAMGARREMAGQQLAKQQYAQQVYADQVNQANALIGAGSQNFAGGLSSLGQLGLMQSLYGNKPTPKDIVTKDTANTTIAKTQNPTPSFDQSDPFGLNKYIGNPYTGMGGIYGAKFGGYGGPAGIGGGYYNGRQ